MKLQMVLIDHARKQFRAKTFKGKEGFALWQNDGD
jgi:hypothetical protein